MAAVTLSLVQPPCGMVLTHLLFTILLLFGQNMFIWLLFCLLMSSSEFFFSQCFASRRLRSVIVIQAQRGNWSKMRYLSCDAILSLPLLVSCLCCLINQSCFCVRFSNLFFSSKLWKITYRSKHSFPDNLLEQVDKCANSRLETQSKLISKVIIHFVCISQTVV